MKEKKTKYSSGTEIVSNRKLMLRTEWFNMASYGAPINRLPQQLTSLNRTLEQKNKLEEEEEEVWLWSGTGCKAINPLNWMRLPWFIGGWFAGNCYLTVSGGGRWWWRSVRARRPSAARLFTGLVTPSVRPALDGESAAQRRHIESGPVGLDRR